jgi:hypothetical protein
MDTKECARDGCSGTFKPGYGKKYCGEKCSNLVHAEACKARSRERYLREKLELESKPAKQNHQIATTPVREMHRRKLGDSIPEGFLESLLNSVARHNKQMSGRWTVHECLTGASMANAGGSMPLRIPGHWKIGSFEDLRLVFESEEFKTLCEKAELEFRYSYANDVPCVIFRSVTA